MRIPANTVRSIARAALIIWTLTAAHAVWAKLPPPTPAQQQAAAEKKAAAAAQAEADKQKLTATMDRIAAAWREHAAAKGWKTHPPTPVSAAAGTATPATAKADAKAGETPVQSEKSGTAPASKDAKPDAPVSIRAPGQ